MTLNSIFRKLRKVAHKQYRQFSGCLLFANILVSSFFAVLFSQVVQSTLPEGGDSRKQLYLIFGIAVVGCYIFVLYATGLFLRHKSKQIGVLLALGTERAKLTKALLSEISYIVGYTTLIGVVLGNILAFIIGIVFQSVAVDGTDKALSISVMGLAGAGGFALVVFICLFIMAGIAMKRTNIMDIINEQRKSEPIKKEVTRKYLLSGMIMLVAGLFLAAILPNLYVIIFKQYLSGLFNLFYLLCVVGLYRIFVYSIVAHRRGKNPQKYYRNLISYGMLKFQGVSIVRNMGLIALLIMGALYASFYVPGNLTSGNSFIERNPVDVSYNVPSSSKAITEQQVSQLGTEFGQQILNYRELHFVELLTSGINRDNIDDSGKLLEKYEKKAHYRQFISVSEINEKMGTDITVADGSYKMIRTENMLESPFFAYDDLDYAVNPETDVEKQLQFAGTEVFNELLGENGWDTFSRFIISDKDFAELSLGSEPQHQIKQILFNVSDIDQSYEFSKTLYKEFCLAAGDEMKVPSFYDEFLEQQAKINGKEYRESEHITLEPEQPENNLNWKFQPYFKIIFKKSMILQYAVQYLLFSYVAVVMLASVAIIGYTRSQSIGHRNRQVFEDIRKLGGNNSYLVQCIRGQLKKIYFLPTIVGSGTIYIYQVLISYQNDGVFSGNEIIAVFIDLGLCLLVGIIQYVGYRVSLKEVKGIVNITE